MNEYTKMKVHVLIEMLMGHTSQMMGMMTDGIMDGEDFTQCRNTILAIQSEIKKHQQKLSVEDSLSPVKWSDIENYKDSGTIN
ncbi:MAG: hypothetical protein ABIR30_11410 [Chitinophagaceae bacterium]